MIKSKKLLKQKKISHGFFNKNGGKSKVQWKGAFYRSFPGQQPPPELTDEACIKAVTKLYKTGLENLKNIAEK